MNTAIDKAREVKLVIFDIDGVLTNGGLHFDNEGREYKTFSSFDGQGIRMLLDSGIQVAIITGRKSELVNHRMRDLGVEIIFQGYRDKRLAFSELLNKTGLQAAQIAYLGDDLPDLPVMTQVGFAIAVDNAHDFVKTACRLANHYQWGCGRCPRSPVILSCRRRACLRP